MQSEAGTLLVEGGLVDESQLQQALTAAVSGSGSLVQNLIRLGFATDAQLASYFASRLQIPLAEAAQFDNLPAFITRLVPTDVVMTHRTVPIMLHQGVLHMAMSDPTNRAALEEISFITGYTASPVAAADHLIEASMARYYGIPPDDTIPVLDSIPDMDLKSLTRDSPGLYSITKTGGVSSPGEGGTFSSGPVQGDPVQARPDAPTVPVGNTDEPEQPLSTRPTAPAMPAVQVTEPVLDQKANPEAQPLSQRRTERALPIVDSKEAGPEANIPIAERTTEPYLPVLPPPGSEPTPGADTSATDEQPGLTVVGQPKDELEELFGLGKQDDEVIHLTRPKQATDIQAADSITDAIRLQVELEKELSESPPPTAEQKPDPSPRPTLGEALTPVGASDSQPAEWNSTRVVFEEGPALSGIATPQKDPDPPTEPEVEAIATPEPPAVQKEEDPALVALKDSEEARYLISQAEDRDEVARTLLRYARSFMPRVVLFIVKKDIIVGWMGAGPGVVNRHVKGIMIPLGSPSVFRTVRETSTDYFGSLPRTTVNDIFLANLGDIRPRQVLLIPVTVRHKPICIVYGDCATQPGFSMDLSGIHLIAQDASAAFEKLILQRKMNRQIHR